VVADKQAFKLAYNNDAAPSKDGLHPLCASSSATNPSQGPSALSYKVQ